MPNIQVVSFQQMHEVEDRAGRAVYDEGLRAATADFKRVAAELAGPDETLERVLLARLVEAHQRGYSLAHYEEHARFNARHNLPAEQYFERANSRG